MIVYKFFATYLDNSSHLDIIVAASSTPCLVDESTQKIALWSLGMCAWAFMEDFLPSNYRQALDSLRICSVIAVSEDCGKAAGAFLESVWEFAEDPEVRTMLLSWEKLSGWKKLSDIVGDCHPQAALVKRFAKRAIDKMRK